MKLTVDALAGEISRIKGGAEPDAVGFAKTLMTFINRHIAAGQQGAGGVDAIRSLIEDLRNYGTHDCPKRWVRLGPIHFTDAIADELGAALAAPNTQEPR